jgi:hypothetical protein
MPNRYVNHFPHGLSPIPEALQHQDIHRQHIVRNNQQSPPNYSNRYPVIHPNANLSPITNNYDMRTGPRLDPIFGMSPSSANGYTSRLSANDSAYLPQDPTTDYMKYRSNSYQEGQKSVSSKTIPSTFDLPSKPTKIRDGSVKLRSKRVPKPTDSSSGSLQPSTSSNNHDYDFFRNFSLSVPGLSTENLSFHQIVAILTTNVQDVLSRYLPHVHFLVSCQQELRHAAVAMKTNVKKDKKALGEAQVGSFLNS